MVEFFASNSRIISLHQVNLNCVMKDSAEGTLGTVEGIEDGSRWRIWGHSSPKYSKYVFFELSLGRWTIFSFLPSIRVHLLESPDFGTQEEVHVCLCFGQLWQILEFLDPKLISSFKKIAHESSNIVIQCTESCEQSNPELSCHQRWHSWWPLNTRKSRSFELKMYRAATAIIDCIIAAQLLMDKTGQCRRYSSSLVNAT